MEIQFVTLKNTFMQSVWDPPPSGSENFIRNPSDQSKITTTIFSFEKYQSINVDYKGPGLPGRTI